MKYSISIISLGFFLLLAFQTQAQHDHGNHNHQAPAKNKDVQPAGSVKDTFKVYGNCGMCKRRIEEAVKSLPSVSSAVWDDETAMLTVQYDPSQVTLDDIQKKIAEVGHDTDKFRAKDETYDGLPGCCQYERANQ